MKRELWNDGWKMWKDKDPFQLVFAVPDDALEVTLPDDALFREKQSGESVNQGRTGFLDGGVWHYYKEWEDDGAEEERALLYFEGVFTRTSVYVNGSLAAENRYPYTGFWVDLSGLLKSREKNQILVTANTMNLSSRYYTGGGIYRDVWMYRSGAVFVRPESFRVTTLETGSRGGRIRVEAVIGNHAGVPETVRVKSIFSQDKKEQKSDGRLFSIRPGESASYSEELFLKDFQTWREEAPQLLCCRMEVWQETLQGERLLDEASLETGLRTVTADAVHGLRINGEMVKLRGACIHHDQGLLGAAAGYEYEYRRVLRLKEAGFNAVRCAHNPASQALLTACDRLGMYVMDEAFDVWKKMKNYADYSLFFSQDVSSVVKAMVEADYNHPSVILYSTGNEIPEIGTKQGFATAQMLYQLFHKLDSTRLITNGINGAFAAGDHLVRIASELTGRPETDFMSGDINQFMGLIGTRMDEIVRHGIIGEILEHLDGAMDVSGYNYMTGRYQMDAEKYPGRVMVGTETYPRQIAENWGLVKKLPSVIGDFTWTGYDYLGETGDLYPQIINQSGDLSVTGVRKPVSYYREIVFGLREKPYIAVRTPENVGKPRYFGPWGWTDAGPLWYFPGEEGKDTLVEVYSAGDEVELFLNEKSIGKTKNGQEYGCYASFVVPYHPGTLRAVSFRDGKMLGDARLQTVENASKLSVNVECYPAPGRKKRIVFANLELQDQEGNPAYAAKNELRLIDRKGVRLLAFGNALSSHRRGYLSEKAEPEGGRALAVFEIQADDAQASAVFEAEGIGRYDVDLCWQGNSEDIGIVRISS